MRTWAWALALSGAVCLAACAGAPAAHGHVAIEVSPSASVADQPNERIKLLTTPFSSYEDSLRADMNRVLAGRNFDFDRDVIAVYLYRWGHSMVYPKPGWPFSAPIIAPNGQVTRVPSARFFARQQIGRISFGAQDVESSPANESAIGAGVRTSGEVLPLL